MESLSKPEQSKEYNIVGNINNRNFKNLDDINNNINYFTESIYVLENFQEIFGQHINKNNINNMKNRVNQFNKGLEKIRQNDEEFIRELLSKSLTSYKIQMTIINDDIKTKKYTK